MGKNYLDEIIENVKKEEKNRERKIGHLVRFLKSDGLSMISDNIVTIEKKKVIETETDIIIIGDAVVGELEEFIEGYSLKISKFGLLDWEEDWFAGVINLYCINSDKQLIIDGARYE